MLTAPSTTLVGTQRPYWEAAETSDCPFGSLFSAICPTDAPAWVLERLQATEREYARSLPSPQRQREWLGGRHCLSTALAQLSVERPAMLQLPSGAPIVPLGTAGSISHKGPLVMALAASDAEGVGIDVDYADDQDVRLQCKVLTVKERVRLDLRGAGSLYVVAHFSLKEAVYKALDPAHQQSLDFDDIEVSSLPLVSGQWRQVGVSVVGNPVLVKAAVLIDGNWVVAVAARGTASQRISDS
ncbi:MAG: 4'-phosphopantetheinyl transferase superfamily protein [Polyangiaceae bacterium]